MPIRAFSSQLSCSLILAGEASSVYEALIPDHEFRNRYTVNGLVYHGTDGQSALTIIETQKLKWPRAVGFNVSRDYKVAAECAYLKQGIYGIVMPVRFKSDRLITAVDLAKISYDKLQEIAEGILGYNGSYSELFTRGLGIDVLVVAGDRHPIILNQDILELPRTPVPLALDLANRITHWEPGNMYVFRDRVWDAYVEFFSLLSSQQQSAIPKPDAIKPENYKPDLPI